MPNNGLRGSSQSEKIQFGRPLVTLEHLGFISPERLLFSEANLTIRQGENVVITGESGSGKSVLLRIIRGELFPSLGYIEINENTSISYVPQDLEDLGVDASITVRELFFKARGLDNVIKRQEELEMLMADPENPEMNAILEEYSENTEKLETKGVYNAESEAEQILAQLDLDERNSKRITLDTTLAEVSSGQRTRLLIAQALFSQADILLLDDPTAHIDIQSLKWLVSYLRQTKQAVIVATNDLIFINSFSNRVVELTPNGRVISFNGTYDEFRIKRDSLLEAEANVADVIREEIARLGQTLRDRLQLAPRSARMGSERSSMKTRVEQLKRLLAEMPGAQKVNVDTRYPNLTFEVKERSGNDVVSIQGKLRKLYGAYTALDLKSLDVTVHYGERFAITGENGSGKSTFLRMIALPNDPDFQPTEGNIRIGTNVQIGYYAPDHLGLERNGANLLELARSSINDLHDGLITSNLRFWGFTNSEIRNKKYTEMSQGEKVQLALCRLMLKKPNLLILDEPTSNLRPEIIDRLISAISGYSGTLIVISHDQDFLDKLKIKRSLHLPDGVIQLH